MSKIKVFICDDHQLMLDGLSLILKSDDQIIKVGEGKNGQELLDWLKLESTDIVLMDINMPVLDGLKTTKILFRDHPNIKVIFLSMINQKEIMPTLQKSGAKGFLMKNSSREQVLNVIKRIYIGDTHFDPIMFSDQPNAVRKVPTNYIPKLTNREKEILKLIISEQTSPDIAEKLYISIGTVDTHRRNLISKLGVKNTAGLVRMAIEYQLVN